MEAPYATERSDPASYAHYLSGWCPGCGRRRGPDARCANCDPWWTSPLFQLGVPAALVSLLLISTASAVVRPVPSAEERPGAARTAPAAWPGAPYAGAAGIPVVVDVPRAATIAVRAPSAVISVTAADIAARQRRDAAFERARVEAVYADAALAAANAAQAEQEYAARNRALTVTLSRQEAAARGAVPFTGLDGATRTAAPDWNPAASAAL